MQKALFGAMIGDIAGSRFEFHSIKRKKGYDLLSGECRSTDDSAMTIAVAEAVMRSAGEGVDLGRATVEEMQRFGRLFPDAGYGGRFYRWIHDPQPRPYNSWGNGSAMRVSACGYAAKSLEEALSMARRTAEVTHDHPEGIRGAQATAAAVYLALNGASRGEIRRYIEEHFYTLDRTLEEIRPGYRFDVSCQGSVPVSILCFLESDSYEDTIRNAISMGGDSDTMAAIGGAIAWAFYLRDMNVIPDPEADLVRAAGKFLPAVMLEVSDRFDRFCETL